MSFQWLHMRIQEERDRRQREALTLERLPQSLEELYGILKEAITAYTGAFGTDAAEMVLVLSRIKITTREMRDGRWKNSACSLSSGSLGSCIPLHGP